jgi:hypothetical protein
MRRGQLRNPIKERQPQAALVECPVHYVAVGQCDHLSSPVGCWYTCRAGTDTRRYVGRQLVPMGSGGTSTTAAVSALPYTQPVSSPSAMGCSCGRDIHWVTVQQEPINTRPGISGNGHIVRFFFARQITRKVGLSRFVVPSSGPDGARHRFGRAQRCHCGKATSIPATRAWHRGHTPPTGGPATRCPMVGSPHLVPKGPRRHRHRRLARRVSLAFQSCCFGLGCARQRGGNQCTRRTHVYTTCSAGGTKLYPIPH